VYVVSFTAVFVRIQMQIQFIHLQLIMLQQT